MTTTTITETTGLLPPNMAKPSFGLRAEGATRSRSKRRFMLPEINVTLANEFVEETLSAMSAPLQKSFLIPPAMHHCPLLVVPGSASVLSQRTRSITPPSVPVLRVNNRRPASSGRSYRNAAAQRPKHRRNVSLPADMMGPLRPLTDGPMGYTYTPTASRSREKLDFFIPSEHYARHKISNISLVMSFCEPAGKQIILCTPGAAHAMGIEKNKSPVFKGIKKVWQFFKKKFRY